MEDFSLWFSTGLKHILDLNAFDHICYVAVLCIPYSICEWKKLVYSVTAFTIGHSITLALATSKLIDPPAYLIELLIPLTILFSCIINLIYKEKAFISYKLNYLSALLFGLIHGMGFSSLLKSMIGIHENILFPLFSFNLGIEIAQLVLISIIYSCIIVLEKIIKIKKADYVYFTSSAIFGIAFHLFLERI